MIGTEKQIAYAQEILRGAKIWYAQKGDAGKLAAIAAIEALEEGKVEEAEEALEEATQKTEFWVDRILTWETTDGSPAFKADGVIAALKGAYYKAKDAGLLTGEA